MGAAKRRHVVLYALALALYAPLPRLCPDADNLAGQQFRFSLLRYGRWQASPPNRLSTARWGRGARQQAGFPALRDGGWIGPRPIGADPVRGEQRLILQHLAEEALGGLEIALGREQEVDRGAVLVDGPVQIAPLAADLDVCLV